MFAVVAALVLACIAVVAYDQFAARQEMRNDLDVLAEIVGSNSTAARHVWRPARGRGTAVRAEGEEAHCRRGHLFGRWQTVCQLPARYRIRKPRCRRFDTFGSRFEGDRLIVYRDIQLASQTAGAIYLESDLGELHAATDALCLDRVPDPADQLRRWPLALSSKLQRAVSEPIAHLARVAKRVSGQKNYTVRAVKQSDDDLGQLIDTFNGMLSEIEVPRRGAAEPARRAGAERWPRGPRNWCWPRTAPRPPAGPRANSWPT